MAQQGRRQQEPTRAGRRTRSCGRRGGGGGARGRRAARGRACRRAAARRGCWAAGRGGLSVTIVRLVGAARPLFMSAVIRPAVIV